MSDPVRRFAACVFDFDGVIVDSEPLHAKAKRLTLRHFGIGFPDSIFSEFKGRTDRDFFVHVAAQLAQGRATADEMEADKHARYRGMFSEVPLVKGAAGFVAAVRNAVARVGLATSATRGDVEVAAKRHPLSSWFDVVVTAEDTPAHKPAPDPYLHALARLGVSPGDAFVVEDSPNGVRSAKAAGCFAVGIATSFPAQVLRAAGADLAAADYESLRELMGL